jgi:hypothetical protein
MDELLNIAWEFNGDTNIASDVDHSTVTSLDLDGNVAEAAADAEALGESTYTFAATETFANDEGGNSNAYSISQVDEEDDNGGGGE